MIIEETRTRPKFASGIKYAGGGDVNISFEFFPPKNTQAKDNLWQAIKKLEPLNPDFVSVTYGAGGSTRKRTHETVSRIASDTKLTPAAHLTCVGASKDEIDKIADDYWQAGVRHIVALRGDPAGGLESVYVPHKKGYAYASDLVNGLKKKHDFDVSVACYPELHPESLNWNDELDNLKRKIDAGASRAITQFFFSSDTFLRFKDRVENAGIDIPIIPGIMLQPNYQGLKRIASLCYISIPDWYHELFDNLDDDAKSRELLCASIAADLVANLKNHGIKHFHFYTLNRADLAYSTCRILGVKEKA